MQIIDVIDSFITSSWSDNLVVHPLLIYECLVSSADVGFHILLLTEHHYIFGVFK